MIIGQAAGVAAKMSLDEKVAVHDIDTAALTAKLRNQRAVMEWKRQETKSNAFMPQEEEKRASVNCTQPAAEQ